MSPAVAGWAFDGHAIVSSDERIADAGGRMPPALRNPADWARFQAALDRAAVVVLGRASHELTPNPKGRTRLVLSARGPSLKREGVVIRWDPARAPLADALAEAATGGVAAVVGGRRVFDHFLAVGYDAFHLATASRVFLPDGVPLFTGLAAGETAADVLTAGGLAPATTEVLDAPNGVSLTVWRRNA